MAIRTQRVCEFDAEVVLSFDWDDTSGQVTAVRCVNGSTRGDVYVGIFGTGSGQAGRSREATFGAGTTVISIPSGQRPRYPVEVNPDTGIAEVGGYTMLARFPA